MRFRVVLAVGAIVFLIAFVLVPIAGGQERAAKPGADQVQRFPDADHPFTPLFDPAGPVTSDPALKAGLVPVPAEYDIVRDVAFPARAGTGGGDMPEIEPNNIMSYANVAHDIPFNCMGAIDVPGDQDWIRVFVTNGEPLQINAYSRVGLFSSPLDPFLAVWASDGSLIAWDSDIAWPTNLNAQVNFLTTYTGDIYIQVRSVVPAGSPNHKYIVEVWPTTIPVWEAPNLETEPNDGAPLADPIALPGVKFGQIGTDGDADWTYFDAAAGATVVVDVHSQIYNIPLDSVVEIFADNGMMLFPADDMDGKDTRFNLVLPYTGRYFLRLSDYSGSGSPFHVYVISVSLQDGTASPHITGLKFNPSGLLKKVIGNNFNPLAERVEVGGAPISIVPSAPKPTTVIKVKPPFAVPADHPITVLVGNGRRSNPVFAGA